VNGNAPPLYLTDADVAALAPPPGALADLVAAVFRARAAGDAVAPPKSALRLGATGLYCQAMPAAVAGVGAGVKWVTLPRDSGPRGLPHVSGAVVLCDPDTGRLQAILEAGALTALRTAAISLVAARRLGRADAAQLTLVGCGVQARAHLDALTAAFPITRVRLLARRAGSAAAFATAAARDGHGFEPCGEPRDALAGADLVVSTVPDGPDLVPFLDAAWLAPGALAIMVDLGRSWVPGSLDQFDRAFTDDAGQTAALAPANPGLAALRFDGDLADLEAARLPGRTDAGQRVAFAFAGSGIADMAAAAAVLRAARERGAGTVLSS
jgi:ornithine cyclodeaminase/alanine dehydrogenase-like protein (mu-crystallin family)